MMGVYIKSIEMPKEGRLTLQISADGAVYVVNSCSITAETYTTDAVPVPPHGRLIDADALITKVTDAAIDQPEIADVYYEEASEIGGWLYSMPTIIPAEEVEE